MHLNDLHPAAGSKKAKRRVGRGQVQALAKPQLVARRPKAFRVAFDPVSVDSYRCRCVYLSLVRSRIGLVPRKCGLAS